MTGFGWRGGWGSSRPPCPGPASEWRWSAAAPRCTWPQCYAALREGTGQGLTDAFPASEHALHRGYDRILVVSRSGTTTEVVDVLRAMPAGWRPRDHRERGHPVAPLAEQVVVLDEVDERSVVQTRFATTTLALLRAQLGHDLGRSPSRAALHCAPRCRRRSSRPSSSPSSAGGGRSGWRTRPRSSCASRRSCGPSSYPAMEYRTGDQHRRAGRVTWAFGELPAGLEEQVKQAGAHLEHSTADPMADLLRVHRLCLVAAARATSTRTTRAISPVRHPGLMRSVGGSPAR